MKKSNRKNEKISSFSKSNNMWPLIILILAILTALAYYFATTSKNNIDEKFQKSTTDQLNNHSQTNNELLFNTESNRFFQENEFGKYKTFFKYGYTVYHHDPRFEKPFKKAYGEKIFVEYSNAEIIEPSENSPNYQLKVEMEYKKLPGGGYEMQNSMASIFNMGIESVDRAQVLGAIAHYGKPQYDFCNYIVLLNYQKPYT